MLDRKIQPDIKSPAEFNVLYPQQTVLPNGVPLNILNVGDKEIVRIDFVFEAGRWQQQQLLQAVFTNRMLREGTVSMTAAQIAEQLDFYGAWLDLSVSANHAFITLYSLSKYLQPTLDVLESMLKEPTFPDKELGIIVATNLQQYYIGLKKTDILARKVFLKALYGDHHPYGKSAEEEDYRVITASSLQTFFNDFYHSKNCSIFVAGKVTTACVEMISSRFGESPFGRTTDKVLTKHFYPETAEQKLFFIEQPEALQSSVRMGMLTLPCNHPDFLKIRVLTTIFGGYFGSRLMSNIREEKGYTYGINAGIAPYPQDTMLLISAETAPEYVRPLIAEVYHEIDRLQQELVSEKELSMVKNYMIGDLCRNYENSFSWLDAWVYAYTLNLPKTHFVDTFTTIKEINTEEIREMARRYLCQDTLKEVVSGKKMS